MLEYFSILHKKEKFVYLNCLDKAIQKSTNTVAFYEELEKIILINIDP